MFCMILYLLVNELGRLYSRAARIGATYASDEFSRLIAGRARALFYAAPTYCVMGYWDYDGVLVQLLHIPRMA